MIRESYFKTVEVEEFFKNIDKKFAASCWHVDMTTVKEEVTYTETTKWFRRYFPDVNVAQFTFKTMECHCIQRIEWAE